MFLSDLSRALLHVPKNVLRFRYRSVRENLDSRRLELTPVSAGAGSSSCCERVEVPAPRHQLESNGSEVRQRGYFSTTRTVKTEKSKRGAPEKLRSQFPKGESGPGKFTVRNLREKSRPPPVYNNDDDLIGPNYKYLSRCNCHFHGREHKTDTYLFLNEY